MTAAPCQIRQMREPLSRTESPSPMRLAADCPQVKCIWPHLNRCLRQAKHVKITICTSRDGQTASKICRRAISTDEIAAGIVSISAVDLQPNTTNNNNLYRQELNQSTYSRAADILANSLFFRCSLEARITDLRRSEIEVVHRPLLPPFKSVRLSGNLSQIRSK